MYIRTIFRLILTVLLLLSETPGHSQQKAPELRFYLFTYSPGQELYSSFGHSAIRVINPLENSDIVYNYGVFYFDDPNFYLNFVKGRLNYQLGRSSTAQTILKVKREHRNLIQNEILISREEKIGLLHALQINYLPQNRYYKYDFLYNNCATRIYELLDSITQHRFVANAADYNPTRFNKLVTDYLNVQHPWANLGFSLISGSQVLKKASSKESQFLPDYLLWYLDNLKDKEAGQPMLGKPVTLVDNNKIYEKGHGFFFCLFGVLFLGITGITIIERKTNRRLNWINWFIFFPSFILGILLLFFWIFSEHEIFAWNYQLLWANPMILLLLLPGTRDNRYLNFFFLGTLLTSIILTLLFLGFYVPILVILANHILRLRFCKKN
jgi:hypothetical protein